MKKTIGKGIRHTVLTIISLIMVFPMLWMVLGSVKTSKEAMDPTMIFPNIIHLENIIEVFNNSPLMKYVANSLIVALITTAIQIVTGAMLAYAFSFIKFKGRNLLFGIVMATYMLPSCATYIPAYVTLAKMGLLNSKAGLIFSQCVSIFGIFLLRTAFLQVPGELIEAAKLDGANDWNGAYGTDWAKVMAGSTMIVIPLLILFAFTQKWFINGLSGDSGVKG